MSSTPKPWSAITLSPSSSILSSFTSLDCAVISRSDTCPPQSGDRNVTSPHGDIPTSTFNVLRLLYCEIITDCCKRLVGRCTCISMQSMITRVDGYFAKHGGMVTSMTFLLGHGNQRGSFNAKKKTTQVANIFENVDGASPVRSHTSSAFKPKRSWHAQEQQRTVLPLEKSSKASGHAVNTSLRFPSHPFIGEVKLPFS